MAVETKPSIPKEGETVEESQTEQPAPNRAARRAAQKKESKDAKVVKTSTKSTIRKSRSTTSATGSGPSKTLNPKTTHYEFGGVPGALAMIIFLPLLVLMFAYGCNKQDGYYPFHRAYHFLTHFQLDTVIDTVKNWKWGSAIFYLAIVSQLAVYTVALPGDEIEGERLRDGTRLKYKTNAISCLQALISMSVMALRGQGYYLFLWVKERFPDITLFSLFFAFFVSFAVYIDSFFGNKLLALGGNTGNPIYDFMIGRELNPRIGKFDIKFFTELRPGLILWIVFNICFAINQWVDLGRLTLSMVLVNLFQGWYVIDALLNEKSILTTMDITTDGFGFMLAFGNLCWVPIMYSLQARYLSDFPVDLSYPHLAIIVLIQCTGYYIFRSANSQKDTFRKNPKDPKVADLKYIETKSGSRLITSGWWGKARHINYFGDWLMSLAWCLPCGFDSIIPYFYCIYFAILLIHRERRDEEKCRKKYGADWERYCSIVKYRIIPGIY